MQTVQTAQCFGTVISDVLLDQPLNRCALVPWTVLQRSNGTLTQSRIPLRRPLLAACLPCLAGRNGQDPYFLSKSSTLRMQATNVFTLVRLTGNTHRLLPVLCFLWSPSDPGILSSATVAPWGSAVIQYFGNLCG